MAKEVTREEVELAFSKLQANVYFDNYDLILRERVAHYKRRLNHNIEVFVEECKKEKPFEGVINKMAFTILPKKVEAKVNKFPSNYYTNTAPIVGNEISKPNVHCDFPVELHLIATIWLMRYGVQIEKLVPKTSLGNRLAITKSTGQIEGRSLFKPYFKQFQNWWSFAIKETKNALKKKQSVTILNFDLKSFYHEVKFDFSKLEAILFKIKPGSKRDVIHYTLKKLHFSYRDLLITIKKDVAAEGSVVPLPIGLFTSHLFANFHLRSLDRFIQRECDPIYYGRYVDDVLVVIKNTVLEEGAIKDEMSKSKDSEIVRLYLQNYFSKLFIVQDKKPIRFKIQSLKDLKLNMEKLFIYQFDQEHTPNLIEKFVEEQKTRSSMFRFLSDEEDESFDDFESQTFESNFDHVDLNKARFKNLEDNKYKLSTFLSKLIKRRVQRGEGYKESELGKIRKYFKGGYLIKHYYFWEKLFTLLVVYKRKEELFELAKEIIKEIDSIQISNSEYQDFNINIEDYKRSLRLYFQNALAMGLGLDMNMLRLNPSLILLLKELLSDTEKKTYLTKGSFEELLERKYIIFRDAGLIRGAFVYYPLFQFTKFAFNSNIDLSSSESIFEVLKSDDTLTSSFSFRRMDFIPFRIKFWQIAILVYYKNLLESKKQPTKKWYTDKFSSNEILTTAFEMFYRINKPAVAKDVLKDEYFEAYRTDKKDEFDDIIIPENRADNYYVQELFIPNSGTAKAVYRIALINKYVDHKDYLSSLDGNPVVDSEKVEIFDRILDEVAQIKNCDLFVMPELSLPHKLVVRYTDQVARSQVGYITGIEHLKIQNIGFNFIFTVLPLDIEGDKDAIPILRLKNHYAPIEEECIWNEKDRGEKMTVPKPNPYRYDLFEWRGLYFASYYCYELADIFHRSIFFSQVDAIIAPVWNPDTHYYNSIIDAATRDMHNYFVIVNTSQYGFSKIARPQDHINKEKVIVKGGTEKEYNFTILVGDLRIKELREFQKMSHYEQRRAKEEAKRKKIDRPELKFKATPPDFPFDNVEKRENNERFYS